MSAPPQYTERSSSQPVEDCRDYLRTGRCKYGASCKYNHPPNVQSGGGMKVPINPSEPMFPIRPNEPVCQYYMKHGTCKFAQACKFHHPPQSQLQALGTTVMVNVGRGSNPAQLLYPVGGGPNGSAVMLQLLPQRPGQPDCIYFLKNGRCKYGATCRYHHPINYHQQQRYEEPRRQRVPTVDPYSNQKVQYVSQAVPVDNRGHVVVTETPVAFMNADSASLPQNYQQVSVVPGNDTASYHSKPLGSTLPTEQGSAASSIASSFDTTSSGLDPLAVQGDTGATLWNRAKRNGSGGSLGAYVESSPGQSRGQVVFPHSASEGNILSRRNRAASSGSGSDHNSYIADGGNVGLRRNESASSMRMDLGPSYDLNRVVPLQLAPRPESSSADPRSRGRPPRGSPRRGRRENDEGFTMMTSALLTMLDTPEEALAEGYSDEDPRQAHSPYDDRAPQEVDPAMFERLSLNNPTSP